MMFIRMDIYFITQSHVKTPLKSEPLRVGHQWCFCHNPVFTCGYEISIFDVGCRTHSLRKELQSSFHSEGTATYHIVLTGKRVGDVVTIDEIIHHNLIGLFFMFPKHHSHRLELVALSYTIRCYLSCLPTSGTGCQSIESTLYES